MAKEIDLSKPLSSEDRAYLVQRDRWRSLAEADGHGDPRRAKAEAEASRGELTQRAHPTTDPQAIVPTPEEIHSRRDEGDSEEPYEDWSFEDLKAELDARKTDALDGGMSAEEAGKRYSKGGSQKELVARLYADDEGKI
jgi:hypothetical protein